MYWFHWKGGIPCGSDVSIGVTGQPGSAAQVLVVELYISPFFGVVLEEPPDHEAPMVKRRPSDRVAWA